MTGIRKSVLAAACLIATSCTNTQNEFATQRSFFIFDNAVHQNSVLAAAMTPHSNVFATIRRNVQMTTAGSVTYLEFTSNQGGTTERSKANAVDLKRSIILGQGNAIVVGYGNLTDPLTFFAYDLECPNCFSANAVPLKDYFLDIASSGMATCKTCHRKYNMNNGGIIESGDKGDKLTRYRATTGGPYAVLAVN